VASALTATCAHAQSEGANLLRDAAYRLDPAPNYDLAPGKTGAELTDGQVGEGRIWTSDQGVSWSWRMPVTITLDLDEPAAIDHVRVHVASGTDAQVYLPSQLLVFGGDGSGRSGFLSASDLGRDENSSARPEVSSIDIRFEPTLLRQIVVVAFARGAYLMLSEIEAFGPADSKGEEPDGTLADAQTLRRFAIDHRQAAIEALQDPRPTGPDIARRWAMSLGPDADSASGACTAERIDPWTGEPVAPAGRSDAAPSRDDPLSALTGGRDYAAWRIVNRSHRPAPVNVAVEAASGVDAAVFALAHVQALDRSWVPDVVTPFEATTLLAGSAMLVLVEASPRQAGRHELAVSIGCGEETAKETLALTAIAADPEVPPLHGNLWTYLHQPLHAPVARGIACDAGFFARYGIDTVVVHPDALKPDDEERPTGLLRQYLDAYRGASRILLYMDIKRKDWAFSAMPDEEAAAWLREWWAWVVEVARDEGVQGELQLYPIDEPRASDLPAMRRFRQLARGAGIEAPVYATLERRALSILPWVDVAQLHRPSGLDIGAAALAGVGEIHGYDTREDARLLSPDGYYRRQGWDAYALGLTGVGVWNAWDGTGLSSPETGWNPFTGERERDFGMVYAAPDGCAWPSLRLLAWTRGLEENRLLRQCASKLPKERIEAELRSVPDDGDTAAADAVAGLAELCR